MRSDKYPYEDRRPELVRMEKRTFIDHLVESRMDERRAAVDKARKYVEDIASEIADRCTTYESFALQMRKMIPRLEFGKGGTVILQHETGPIHLDLKWMYKAHNPTKHEEHGRSWDSYGEARTRGEYANKDGWTGD